MKRSHVVFGVSLVLNLAVLAAFLLRPSLAPAAFRETFNLQPATSDSTARAKKPAPARAAPPRKIWPMLATDDLATLVARLRAAGFPASTIREIIRAEVNARYEPKIRAYTQPDPSAPYWKASPLSFRSGSGRIEEYQQLQRERTKLLRELLADPFFASADVSLEQRQKFGNLSRQKIDALQRIEDDYAEMMSAIRASTNGVLLPEDKAKLAFLANEKKSDLASVLSPAELAEYEMRSSPITRLVASELGDFRASEAEFRAIFEMQRAMNEKFPYTSGGSMGTNYQERREVEKQLAADLRAKLGEARFNEYQRETNPDYQQLRRLVERENLPPNTAQQVFDTRFTLSQETMRIFNDPALSHEQKQAAVTAAAQRMRTQVLSLLGPNAGPGFIEGLNRQWLNIVERGIAVTFDGGPNRSIGSDNVLVSLGSGPRFHNLPPATPPPPR